MGLSTEQLVEQAKEHDAKTMATEELREKDSSNSESNGPENGLRACIISLGSKSSKMTAEALSEFFEHVDMLQLKEMEVVLGKDAGVFFSGKPLEYYDCVFIKGSFRYAHLLRSITSMLEGKVPYLPLPASSFTIVHNKLLTHLALQQQEIPMPKTYVSPNTETAKELLKRVNYPIVMKFPEGTQGKGVMFADSISSASSLLDALGALNQPFIIQEYVETGGTDLRVIVIGDRAIAGMERKATTDEKRANIHAGGSGQIVELSRETKTLAIKTARALNAEVCGVDILEGPLGPVVIEANISPGLQGVTAASGINVAREIAKHMYQQTVSKLQIKTDKHKQQVVKDMKNQENNKSEIITNLQFKGERIILPKLVTEMTEFSELENYVIKSKKGKLEIVEFKM
ncbi:hypothetical protein CL619_04690 [archaeon]|nr:hypothetical protein [archaeon]|tara:strand:- start:2121 stop:3323 length:1203 start_codon:yes stop_codon:yes gene_type:complete